MTHMDLVVMVGNQSLLHRIAAAAAEHGIADPPAWVEQNKWQVCTQPGWVEAWEYAEGSKTVNLNPDTGARTDVINDGMVTSAVAEVVATQQAS
jgi:hypothetical protein